jgi:hypothetical protein
MSTQQRNDACRVAVDPHVADILRAQTLAVLEANHHHFEDVRDFPPSGRLAVAAIYRDAFAVLDAVGWVPPTELAATAVEVPLTSGHANQLRRCRQDLGRTNLDRLHTLDQTTDPGERARIRKAIDADRIAADALDGLLGACRT